MRIPGMIKYRIKTAGKNMLKNTSELNTISAPLESYRNAALRLIGFGQLSPVLKEIFS